MEVKVVEHEYQGEKTGGRRLEIIPSHMDGHFLVRDKNFDRCRANKVGVFNASQADMDAVTNADKSLSDFLKLGGDSYTAEPRGDVELVAETYVGSGSWSLIRDFVEFTPVDLGIHD